MDNIFHSISKTYNSLLYKTGQRSYLEYFIKSYKPEYQGAIKDFFSELSSTEVVKDPAQFYRRGLEFEQFLETINTKKDVQLPVVQADESSKSYILRGSADMFGYRPSGTKLWNYFANPFGVFAYISEQYWAIRRAIDLIREAVESDGFYLKSIKGTSETRLAEVYKILKNLKVDELRVELIAHLQNYGNAFILPHRTRTRGIIKLELLLPNKLLPIFDRSTEEIIAWEYTVGRMKITYDVKDILHLKLPSLSSNKIGSPPLVSAITEIETILHAMNLNNTIFQKGGLIGWLISLENPKDADGIPTARSSDWVKEVQAQFDFLHAGAKAGHGVLAMNNIKDVHQMMKPGELDANYLEGKDHTAKMVSTLLGVPSEKIGIPRSTTAQYQPSLVENVVNAQFDATINRLTSKIDGFLNQQILVNLLGIQDIKIVPSGRYGALTLAAAQTINFLATTGKIITVNEAREKILGWEPLPPNDPRGNIVLDNSPLKATGEGQTQLPDLLAPEQSDPDLNEIESDKILEEIEALMLKVGGKDDGEYFHKRNKKAL